MSAKRGRPELRYTGTWWFDGSEAQWQALPLADRDALSFKTTGCRVAYPTWKGPVDCVHIGCQIARGEKPMIAKVNAQLRGEKDSGWLRFVSDRSKLAAIFRAHRANAMRTGVYDIWENGGWQLTVSAGVMS